MIISWSKKAEKKIMTKWTLHMFRFIWCHDNCKLFIAETFFWPHRTYDSLIYAMSFMCFIQFSVIRLVYARDVGAHIFTNSTIWSTNTKPLLFWYEIHCTPDWNCKYTVQRMLFRSFLSLLFWNACFGNSKGY